MVSKITGLTVLQTNGDGVKGNRLCFKWTLYVPPEICSYVKGEHRVDIKFLLKLGKSVTETYALLKEYKWRSVFITHCRF